jgi:hypothetical protein
MFGQRCYISRWYGSVIWIRLVQKYKPIAMLFLIGSSLSFEGSNVSKGKDGMDGWKKLLFITSSIDFMKNLYNFIVKIWGIS